MICYYNLHENRVLWVGNLQIRWGNRNAVDGSRIPWYISIVWWPRENGKFPRCLFSTYTGD